MENEVTSQDQQYKKYHPVVLAHMAELLSGCLLLPSTSLHEDTEITATPPHHIFIFQNQKASMTVWDILRGLAASLVWIL